MPRLKHIPSRTCAACHRKRSKREMVRIVRTPYASVQVDLTGKLNGRGAYLCPDLVCWQQSLSQKRLARLEYAVRGRIAPEDRERLLSYAASLDTTVQESAVTTS